MIFDTPVKGTLRVDARFYPQHPDAWKRPVGSHEPLMTQDFGPSSVLAEPKVVWPGGEGVAAGTYAHFHKGIDISTSGCGAEVRAAAPGKVILARIIEGGSLSVVLDHGDGWGTSYAHLAAEYVTPGQKATAGQTIGRIGSTGALACHLHWSVKSGVDFARSYYDMTNGRLHDPYPRLRQNVKVRPTGWDTNIRLSPGGLVYAQTATLGEIIRKADNVVIGDITTWRSWFGTVVGTEYVVDGVKSTKWEEFLLDGQHVFVASLLAERSAT